MFGVGHSVQAEVERLEKPYQNRCHEDDAKGTLDEVLRLVPDEAQNALRTWQTIVGKLHNERHSLAAERYLLHDECHDDAHKNRQQVKPCHDKAAIVGEEGRDEETIDGELGSAAHKRRQHHRHAAVAFGGQRAGCHHAGNGATEAHE